MEPIVVDIELTATDWDALNRHLQERIRRRTSRRDMILNGVLGAVPALVIVYFMTLLNHPAPFAVLGVGALIVAASMAMLVRRVRSASRPTPASSTWAPTRLEFDATGLRVTRQHQVGVVDWRAVESVDETSEHVFLPLDRLLAYAVPKRQIVSIAPADFVAQIRRWHAGRRAPGAAPAAAAAQSSDSTDVVAPGNAPRPAPPPQDPTAARSLWPDLRSNFSVGMRTFFFRRVQPSQIVPRFDQVAALLIALLAVVAILDRATAGVDAEFNSWGVYTWIALLLMGLWSCALIARSVSDRADTRTLLVVVLATAPWGILATTLLGLIPGFADRPDWYLYAVLAIALWSSLRAIHATYGAIPRPARIIVAVSLVAFAVAQDYLYFDAHLWTEVSNDEDDFGRPTGEEAEAIFFDQQGRIDEALDKLEPQRPGVTDLYYVGFAGDANQRVFRRESLLGERVFADRLGTGPRSLELINDLRERETFPLATQVSLRYSLSQIGEAMDPNEDVLVLLLTSHGSREGGVSVRNGVSYVGSRDLPPNDLRSALDDAGIRWRIVIVSACYSGVFVEPLKTDTTMILTAADSQHTSFGCADDRDLTYFGEAFLQDALPKAASLAAAFQSAREAIAEREKKENLTPSNPQMWVGASMKKKLAELGDLPLGPPVATSSH